MVEVMTITTLTGEPIPDVPPCYGHPTRAGKHFASCEQCDGSHPHDWIVARIIIPGRAQHERTVRCHTCGALGCQSVASRLNHTGCTERYHHRGPHRYPDGRFTFGRLRRVPRPGIDGP